MRDTWLTGFDAPCLHTLYVDKPMHGHGLKQAIARVNHVLSDKPGGLVVDYLGLAENLRKALATYTESGGQGETAIDQPEAVATMLEKVEVCRDLFHGGDVGAFVTGTPVERLLMLPAAQEHSFATEGGTDRREGRGEQDRAVDAGQIASRCGAGHSTNRLQGHLHRWRHRRTYPLGARDERGAKARRRCTATPPTRRRRPWRRC